jgi:hypothetical protein
VDPSYFSIPNVLKFRGQRTLFYVSGISLDTSWNVSPFWRTLSVRLVIVGAIIVIVPLIALLLLITHPISAPIFNPVACISAADDVSHVTVLSAMPSTMLLWGSDATGRVPMRRMPVVILVTQVLVLLVMDWIHYSCCV